MKGSSHVWDHGLKMALSVVKVFSRVLTPFPKPGGLSVLAEMFAALTLTLAVSLTDTPLRSA